MRLLRLGRGFIRRDAAGRAREHYDERAYGVEALHWIRINAEWRQVAERERRCDGIMAAFVQNAAKEKDEKYWQGEDGGE